MSPLPFAQVKSCWENVTQHSQLAERQAAAEKFNRNNRWRKRGISVIPTKFGISFTTKASSAADGIPPKCTGSSLVCVASSPRQSMRVTLGYGRCCLQVLTGFTCLSALSCSTKAALTDVACLLLHI